MYTFSRIHITVITAIISYFGVLRVEISGKCVSRGIYNIIKKRRCSDCYSAADWTSLQQISTGVINIS